MSSYITYLSSVLGISGIIGAASGASILFVAVLRLERPSLLSQNEGSTLFGKMLAAIGLRQNQIQLLEVESVGATDLKNWLEKYSSVVVLDDPAQGSSLNQANVLWTFHPQELLLNGSLKKQAWEHLKKISSGTANV